MFLPCVLVPGAYETRGGGHFLNFVLPNTGGRASSANFFCETQVGNGRQICCPLFFAHVGFLGCLRWQQGMH